MKALIIGLVLTNVLAAWRARAEEASVELETTPSVLRYGPQIKTVFPIFLGAGGSLTLWDRVESELLFGVTPRLYYESIGAVAATWGGNSAYRDVIEAAFRNNSMWRFGLQYDFESVRSGWRVGLAYSRLRSSGYAGIDTVLSAATGLDFSILKSALAAAGVNIVVAMNSSLDIGEVHGGYAWTLAEGVILEFAFGVTKVISNKVKLSTGLSAFEATRVGRTLISNAEKELESIINQYGISPTGAVSVSYQF